MIEETRNYISSQPDGTEHLKLLDSRMQELQSVGFVPNFKHINRVWVSTTSLQANEYRVVMQVSYSVAFSKDFISEHSDLQVAPLVLRGIVPGNIVQCFVLFWNWYNSAVRSKSHTDKSLRSMDTLGKT